MKVLYNIIVKIFSKCGNTPFGAQRRKMYHIIFNPVAGKKKAVKNAVKKAWITAAEYEEIVGEPYSA